YHTPTTLDIYPPSLHDALPIYFVRRPHALVVAGLLIMALGVWAAGSGELPTGAKPSTAAEARLAPVLQAPRPSDRQVAKVVVALDRKSTRLNSSHVKISYAVFC